ncbi:MAG TPA: amidase [Chitinophagaceae bacterium]|nr:amidase [Chitinophagaceae bacterium]
MSRHQDNSLNESRRRFLKSGIAGSIAAVSLPSFSFAQKTMDTVFLPFARAPFDLDEITIDELHAGFISGKHTVRSVTEKYIQRIKEMDASGPAVNSVIEINPDALKIADGLDKELKEKGPRSLMHGIPVLIKDNIDTADNMETTAGSFALVGSRPEKDSFIVKQLRDAGALILGKTNLSEWANMRSTHSTSGWSGRGGLTKNPYALDRNTSGSSSGSGAATAANLCAVAIGTETDGSIVSPSSLNGLVGIKPTVGLVSRAGIIPISHSQDTAGPMTRTVRDAAILLSAIAGEDEEDDATQNKDRKQYPDYTKFLDKDGLKGARIGVLRKYFGFLPAVDKIINDALDILKQNGAILVDPVIIDSLGKFDDSEGTVLSYELKAGMAAYLKHRGANTPFHTLKDLIDFNEKNADKEMPYFGQELFLEAENRGPLTDKDYLEALDRKYRLTREEGIDAIMNKHNLDAIVSPTDSPAWVTDLVDGDHFLGGSSQLAAVAGYPHITVPAGQVMGLPVGISFFGRAWSEPALLKIAYAFEQITKARRPPEFLPTVNIKS